MIRKISSLCEPHINRNSKKRWQLVAEQVMKCCSTKEEKGTFTIRTLTCNDKKPTLAFLYRFFFRDEPLNQALKLLDGPNDRCIDLEEFILEAIDDGISVAAVSEKGKLVGVVINSFLCRNKVEHDGKSSSNPKFQTILRVLEHLDTQSRFWEKVPSNCNTLVDFKIASTDPNWRRRNIMMMLGVETERLAKKHGACGLHMNTTSSFSARVAERLGYRKIFSEKYAKILNGPQPKPPHVEACTYLKVF